jgi:hypothetical protein
MDSSTSDWHPGSNKREYAVASNPICEPDDFICLGTVAHICLERGSNPRISIS